MCEPATTGWSISGSVEFEIDVSATSGSFKYVIVRIDSVDCGNRATIFGDATINTHFEG